MSIFKIQVIHTDTGELVKTLTATSARRAERIEDGININLDRSKYHTVCEETTDD